MPLPEGSYAIPFGKESDQHFSSWEWKGRKVGATAWMGKWGEERVEKWARRWPPFWRWAMKIVSWDAVLSWCLPPLPLKCWLVSGFCWLLQVSKIRRTFLTPSSPPRQKAYLKTKQAGKQKLPHRSRLNNMSYSCPWADGSDAFSE